jgi:YjbE family integral membrane protein
MVNDAELGIALLEIVWVNILLSGDNAVVIALACRSLPARQQTWGIVLGTAPAVLMRIVFAIFLIHLMTVPYLRMAGAVLLFWIAVAMLQPGHDHSEAADTVGCPGIWGAVRTIVLADAVMSLDNVVAIAAAARGNIMLLVLGLVISMPLVMCGSTLIIKLLSRFPALVTLSGALIGYIGGEAFVEDPAAAGWIAAHARGLEMAMPVATAVLVVAAGHSLARLKARRKRYDLVT